MDLSNVQWDTTASRRSPRYRPTVRIVSYNGGIKTDAVFSKSAIKLILGHSQTGHVKIGLQDTHLIIIPCSAEDLGSRSLELRPGKSAKRAVAADGVGQQLKIDNATVWVGEVLMKDRDTFRAELSKTPKQSNKT